MPTKAIVRHTVTTVFTFTGKPTEETRRSLIAAGYFFDARSKQWVKRIETIELVSEDGLDWMTDEKLARDIGVQA